MNKADAFFTITVAGPAVSAARMPLSSFVALCEPSRPSPPEDAFWRSRRLEELATEQGVPAGLSFEDYLGGWPEEEVHDDFELGYGRAEDGEAR